MTAAPSYRNDPAADDPIRPTGNTEQTSGRTAPATSPHTIGPQHPRIDVTLPYYGDVELMKEAVRSVLGQQYQNWQLLVVDDGYPDPEPGRFFAAIDDPRVTYQRNEQNLGANGNFRKCLTLVTAPVMIVMGADDIMLPNYLDVVARAFTTYPEAAVVQVGVQVIDEKGRSVRPLGDRIKSHYRPKTSEPVLLAGEELAASLMRGNWTYFPSLAWRTATVTGIGFREGLNVTQDLALLLDTVRSGGSMVLDPTLAFLYRRHSQSDSSVKAVDGSRFDEERRLFATERSAFEQQGWDKAARAARWHISSRLNALSLIPTAARVAGVRSVPRLVRHVLG